ncbi:hypothetical protein [Streptomyces sp. NPDC029004]|uniref:hypothetical protein n=1 Tax=Streptomyces sp. NPDC029004 TaxID=3154490 RepID=UPI0033F5F256
MVGQIRKIRDRARPDAGWWRKHREWRARQRLVDLAVAGDPELLDEAELRRWKSHMTLEVLLEFAFGALKLADIELALSRLETVHAATYEDLERVKQKLAEAGAGPRGGLVRDSGSRF